MTFETHHATLEDTDELLELWERFTDHLSSFDDRYAPAPDASDHWLSYFEDQLLDSRYGTVVVAETPDDGIVGVIEVRVMENHPMFKLGKHGRIYGLHVRDDWQRQGVADALLTEAGNWLTTDPRNASFYRMKTFEDDEETQAAYERLGLEPVERVYEGHVSNDD